jgi:hypothetical protein
LTPDAVRVRAARADHPARTLDHGGRVDGGHVRDAAAEHGARAPEVSLRHSIRQVGIRERGDPVQHLTAHAAGASVPEALSALAVALAVTLAFAVALAIAFARAALRRTRRVGRDLHAVLLLLQLVAALFQRDACLRFELLDLRRRFGGRLRCGGRRFLRLRLLRDLFQGLFLRDVEQL